MGAAAAAAGKETMFDLINEVSELVYVADFDTYDLLYVNTAGREMFQIKEGFAGRKCYEVLQGRNAPCPFCTNVYLTSGQNYNWEFTNPILGRHYLLKDRLVEWEGKKARLEIAFDISESVLEREKLQNTLDAEQMVLDCVRGLYQDDTLSDGMNNTLATLGTYLDADRTYIFEIEGSTMSNTYEWCNTGVRPEMEQLQGLEVSAMDRWRPAFDRDECVIIEDLEDIRETSPEEYDILHMQAIRSLVAMPLKQNERLIGYLGVDNPPAAKIENISPLLHTLRYFIMAAYQRDKDKALLTHLSYFDTLTGLYNRNRYTHDIEGLEKEEGPLGIAYLDVNGLKDINDQYGHAYGDQVLVRCAQKIRSVFGNADYYRIGGDEFIVIDRGAEETKFLEKVYALRRTFENDPDCQAAVGSQWTEDARSAQELIIQADERMYADKKRYYYNHPSSNRYRHQSDDVLGLTAPGALERQLKDEKFMVYLQPKVRLDDKSTVGAEALIRYRASDDSILLPGHFLPLLEDSDLISQVDFYVFEIACSKVKQWIGEGRSTVPVSVNFSRNTLAQPGFIERLITIADKYQVPRQWLEIEITESVETMADIDVKALIAAVHDAGFTVSVDDFGTHYANLSLLSAVDFDVLKIDKSLVDDIVHNEKTRSLLGALAQVCKQMGTDMIAEGIESQEQADVLRGLGIAKAQGFLFSKPVPLSVYETQFLK